MSRSSSAADTSSRRPTLSFPDAAEIARTSFGLDGEIRELDGDRDRNFLLRVEGGERYVLKVSGPWADPADLALQNAVLEHLGKAWGDDPGAGTPRPVAALDGRSVVPWTDGDGRPCRVRLVTFLSGSLYSEIRPQRAELRRSLGTFMGRLDRCLESFEDGKRAAGRAGNWDLSEAARVVRARVESVVGDESRQLVLDVARRLEDVVGPRLAALPRGLIHHDANDNNVLVELDEKGAAQVTGLIDFGDMAYSCRVFEPAVAAAYAGFGSDEPLRAAADVVAGYHGANPLSEDELELLFDLIRGRLAVTVCMAAYQRALEPDNEYLSISEAPAWRSLEILSAVHPDLALATFRVACGLRATADHDAIVAWLESERGSFAPLVDGRLDTAPVLDLSIGSPLSALLAAQADPTDPRALMEHIDRLAASPDVDVVLGRYDEPRLLYAAPQFTPASSGLEQPENRTVHIGIDLFQPAGAPIYAPMDGTLHSFADNALALDYGPTLMLRHEIPAAEIPAADATRDGEPLVFYTLYGHLDRASLDGKKEGMTIRAGELLGHLGDETVNGGWAPHLHFQILLRTLGRRGEFAGVAAPTDRRLWLDLCPDADLMVGVPQDRWPPKAWSGDEILERRRQVLGRNLSISYGRHLHIVAGRGAYLYDAAGRAYLDAVNNVPHVGHCHPRVVRAGQEQMAVLCTNTRYLHEDLVRYAERLTATFPDPLNVCIFCCSGSEANDLALRMARLHTGKERVIVVDGAYHGTTRQLIELSPYKFDGPGGGGAPVGTYVAPLPCGYRGPHKHGDPEIGAKYAAYVAEACADAAGPDGTGPGVAAFLCESVLGCGGQVVLPPGYLSAAYAHAREAGALCLADEVQVGFGRVGSHMWAFETQGVVPDIVTLGKPIGNGHPMSAVITTAEIAESFANGMEYFNTFAGSAVSCRIGMAVLDVLEDEDLQGNAARTGGRLLDGLRLLAADHPIIGEVRGLGLFIGVELVLDRKTLEPAAAEASYIAERMRDHGILISTDGPLHNVLKIKPPLVFGPREADRLVETLGCVLKEERIRRVEPAAL